MTKKYRYVVCSLTSIPDRIIFDVPRANQGQIVEIAYGDFGRDGGAPGDPYKRVTDYSTRSVTYYRREEIEPGRGGK
jgi:hypothetical protein